MEAKETHLGHEDEKYRATLGSYVIKWPGEMPRFIPRL